MSSSELEKKTPARLFRCEFQVRGYELDAYGHVNNAVYLNYAEFARWCMVEEAQEGASFFSDRGVAPVVVRAEVDYREPCYLAETLVVETRIEELRTRAMRFRQLIKKKETGNIAADVLITAVVVDKSGKAVLLPDDFAKFFL